MRIANLILLLVIIPIFSFSREIKTKKERAGGDFELGVRTTISSFSNTNSVGTGFG